MKIVNFIIRNYKSLKDVHIWPSDFNVLIGPNGSGKSNLASAFDFLSDVYQSGLEYAIAKKGGYENIAYRKLRRTKSAIEFALSVDLPSAAARRLFNHQAFRYFRTLPAHGRDFELHIKHYFSFRASQRSLGADYSLEQERLDIVLTPRGSMTGPLTPSLEFTAPSLVNGVVISFEKKGKRITANFNNDLIAKDVREFIQFYNTLLGAGDPFELFFKQMFPQLVSYMSGIAVHQFSPQISRGPGSPSPNPRLSGYGQNLPSLVDWLKRHHKKNWVQVEAAMKDILPDLEEISVGYLHTKQLGLFFKEASFGRAWAAEDVSDGTIQTLSIFAALVDPRNSVLFIEEPENSVHPWIVRQIARQLRLLSKRSQIFVTTHSPLILNVVEPSSVLVCYKSDGGTYIKSLAELEPGLLKDWESGVDRLFDLLDTGYVKQAVPLPGGGE